MQLNPAPLFLLLTLALTPQPMPAYASSGIETEASRDLQISSAVDQRLAADNRLRGAQLEILTEDGIVRIRGEVEDVDSAVYLIELAEAVEGVEAVNVNLKTRQ